MFSELEMGSDNEYSSDKFPPSDRKPRKGNRRQILWQDRRGAERQLIPIRNAVEKPEKGLTEIREYAIMLYDIL